MEKRKVRVTKERALNTYAELWRTSFWTLEQAKKEPDYFQVMSSLIFTAFTLEAYLNHLGKRVFVCWNDLEPLSPIGKLNVIAERISLETDYSRRPFQTIRRLLKFRNDVAHGKSMVLKPPPKELLVSLTDEDYMHEPLEADWEKYCTLENAKRSREDVEAIIRKLHDASPIRNERLFFLGATFTSGELLEE